MPSGVLNRFFRSYLVKHCYMKHLPIAMVLLSVAFTACQQGAPLERAKFKTIMIKSQGEVEAQPDMATFMVNLNCLNPQISKSKECLIEKSNSLKERIMSFAVPEEDIVTNTVNMHKSYTWQRNSRVFEGYRSTTNLIVSVKNLEKLDLLYTELLGDKDLELGGLSYDHSQFDSLKNEAYFSALKKGNVLAKKLVKELPEDELEILKIGNVEITASLPQAGAYDEMDAMVEQEMAMPAVVSNQSRKTVAINKGLIQVQATLFIEYQID